LGTWEPNAAVLLLAICLLLQAPAGAQVELVRRVLILNEWEMPDFAKTLGSYEARFDVTYLTDLDMSTLLERLGASARRYKFCNKGSNFANMRTCLSAKMAASSQMEFRLRRHDGEYRWIFDQGVPRFNDEGSFAGVPLNFKGQSAA
jgi:hypothetical protein